MNSAPQLRSSRALSSLTCALPALWLAFTSSVNAQVSCNEPPEIGRFIPSPQGYSGSYKRLASGDVSGDWNEEVATIKGNTLFLYHGPNIYNLSVAIDSGAIDLCFAPGSVSVPAGFVYTTSGGLSRVTFDLGSHLYDADSVSPHLWWQNAPVVRWSKGVVGSTTGNGLFGVRASDNRTIFRAPEQSSGISDPIDMFPHGYDILDIVPLNWDWDSQMELAILDSHGVQVREQDGTLRMNRAGQIAGDGIAVVHNVGSTDSLAWITRLSGWSKLLLFNQNFLTQGPLQISTGAFHSMANADVEGDGDDDLVLASSTSNALLVLYNGAVQEQSPWFSMAQGSTGSIDMSMPCGDSTSSGKILCANLFNQWFDENCADNELVPPRPLPSFALVLPNVAEVDGLRILPQQEEEGQLPSLADLGYVEYQGARALNGTPCDLELPETFLSNWRLTLGDGWGLTNATHIEMIVRKCPEHETAPVEEPLHHGSHKILPVGVPAQINGFVINFSGAENGSLEDLAFDYRYFVELRPIRMSGTTVLRTWRWSIMGLSPTCDGTSALRALPGAGSPLFEIDFNCCGNEPSCPAMPGAFVVPSAIPLSEIPNGPGYPGDPPPPEQ